MLSILLIISCNTPETIEVPPLPVTEQPAVIPNVDDDQKGTNQGDSKKSDKTEQNTLTRTAPFFSEVMQIPVKVAKFRGEWIELYNPTDATIDLSTYSVHSKGDKGVSFTKEHTIKPKSAFLMAVRKSPSGNGGLPSVDFLYNHDVLKIAATDWIELRNGNEVVDRWEITRTDVKKGYSLQRNENGTLCHAAKTYGDGDYGSPKAISSCP